MFAGEASGQFPAEFYHHYPHQHFYPGKQGFQESCQGLTGKQAFSECLPYQLGQQQWQPWGDSSAQHNHSPAFPSQEQAHLTNSLHLLPASSSPLPHEVPTTPSPSSLSPPLFANCQLTTSPTSFPLTSILHPLSASQSNFGHNYLQMPPKSPPTNDSLRMGAITNNPPPLPSPPSSHSSENSIEAEVFFPPPPPVHPSSATQYTFPPIQLKNNQSFTEAELKAITPWRNQLLERLLANRSVTPGPPQNVPHRKVSGAPPKQRPPVVRPGTALFNDPGLLNEFNFGPGSTDYLGSVRRGTTAFLAIQGSINQANQGSGTVRAVVETILKFCLPRDLSEYSLTGKSLQEKLEVRNGQAQSRVVMAERGTSKQGVPTGLLAGMVGMFEVQLTEAGRRGAGGNLGSYTRKLVSKTCSRSQEKKNQEVRTAASKRGKRDRNGNEL